MTTAATPKNATPTQISISNIGPVFEFECTLDTFGMYVLRGKQGAGKTTILRTVQLATDGRTDMKPTRRDGTPRGEATIAGKTIRIARQTREEGNLTVDGLGDFDISSLHTPKFIDKVTKDRHRIKVLVQLAGVKADASLFYRLVGGEETFQAVVGTNALETDDLVEMAAKVKRAFERAAIAHEEKEQTALANMRHHAGMAEGVDLEAPHDAEELQKQATDAAVSYAQLQQKRTDARIVMARAGEAQGELDAIVQPSLSVADATAAVETAAIICQNASAHVKECEETLQFAQVNARAALQLKDAAEQDHMAAQQHAETIDRWQVQIDAGKYINCPSNEEVADACAATQEATRAISAGMAVCKAIIARKNADEWKAQCQDAAKGARRLRDAAHDTMDVLTEAIAGIPDCPLKVKSMDDGSIRLVIATDRSETEPFDELSEGERWPVILKLAAASNRLIVLPQAAYGEFSDSTRLYLHNLAIEHKCYLLTAQADDGELRAELYPAGEIVDPEFDVIDDKKVEEGATA